MNAKAQIIFDKGRPAFVVLPYAEYLALAKGERDRLPDDGEFIPFRVGDFIKNPVRVLRIEAGLNQSQLAILLGVTQGYVSRIEGRNFRVSAKLLDRVQTVLKKRKRK